MFARIAGEFTVQPLVVRGLTYPVNLGQHFLGRHCCILDFAHGVHTAGGLGPDTPCESGATLPELSLVQPEFCHGVHPARCLGTVCAAGGPLGEPTTVGQEGDTAGGG